MLNTNPTLTPDQFYHWFRGFIQGRFKMLSEEDWGIFQEKLRQVRPLPTAGIASTIPYPQGNLPKIGAAMGTSNNGADFAGGKLSVADAFNYPASDEFYGKGSLSVRKLSDKSWCQPDCKVCPILEK